MSDNIEEHALLANLAQDYYLSELSLAQLAKKYHLSRYLVNKYLDDARRKGIVSISIASPAPRNLALEKIFQQHFSIPYIAIMRNSMDPLETKESSFHYAAQELTTLISGNKTIGLTWGVTLYNLLNALPASIQEDVTFCQFIGDDLKPNSAVGAMRLVRQTASKFSANALTLPAPLYMVSDQNRTQLAEEIALKPTMAAANQMDVLVTTPGTLDSLRSVPLWRDHESELFPQTNLSEAVGMLFGRPYDIQGRFLNQGQDKTFGANLENILATPRRLGIVNTNFKTQATLGALRGNFFTDLLITEALAERILIEIGVE